MTEGGTIVLDVGKTNAKLSLWDAAGGLVERHVRANNALQGTDHRPLDVIGIDNWLLATLADLAHKAPVARIIPVGHGAAAAMVSGGKLLAAPFDYEQQASADERRSYAEQRDPFATTGSPFLPQLLNLGLQLHRFENRFGTLAPDTTILPWPQYWAWRLCGVAASEVSSLGCHTDLWQPVDATFSNLAVRRGWDERLAPLVEAGQSLGRISPDVADATGLPVGCEVLCGLHDSNAALVAARGHREIAANEATVLSTGTWFVAMRSLGDNADIDLGQLDEARDCLVNVDVRGRPVPSARFMGGREAELAGSLDSFSLTRDYEPDALLERVQAVLERPVVAYPGFVAGVGPFPEAAGHWQGCPENLADRRIATCLYLALMADTMLDLIGSSERLLIEGRFAEEVIFARALAALRPTQRVFVSNAHNDVAYGALRLVNPSLEPPSALIPVTPLDDDLSAYAGDWRDRARNAQAIA